MAASEAIQAEIQERKRAEQVARGQTEALAKMLTLLAAEPELDKFVGQVLRVLTEQLGARSGSFWLYDASQDATLLYLEKLYIGKKTVDFHLSNVYEKLGVTSRLQAYVQVTRLGLFPD